MTDLSPGQEVYIGGASGGPATVVYVRGDSVRVLMHGGKPRTVPLQRVTPMSSHGHDELRRWREQGRAPAGSCPFCASRICVIERDGVFVARCSHRGCGARGPRHHDLTRACDLFCCPPQRTAGGMGGPDGGKPRTVPLKRVTPKRESKALVVGPAPLNSIADMLAPIQRVYDQSLRPVPKPVTLRSEPYLAYVRKHPCCLCGASPSEAHHWSHHGGVMGSKVDDYRTVPLCTEHHRHWHDHGTFPEMDREHSEAALMREQAWLLRAWLDNNVAHYGDQVDALIRAIGGADA